MKCKKCGEIIIYSARQILDKRFGENVDGIQNICVECYDKLYPYKKISRKDKQKEVSQRGEEPAKI